jgi:hypothetical protein
MNYRLTNSSIQSLQAEDLYNYHIRHQENVSTKFLSWCEAQETNRFLWLALSFFAQIGLTLPLTAVFIIFFGGNNLVLWIIAGVVNIPVLVLNLAAFPTKITLPFVFFGWLTQAIIVMYCIVFALMH